MGRFFILELMRIIFFHHAGGDKYAFLPYKPILDELGWEAVYYELPGHGDRYQDTLLTDANLIAKDAYDQLRTYMKEDYILFGNSMGSLISYLVLHKIVENGLLLPLHFFVASRKCPASYIRVNRDQLLSDLEFWQIIREYNGPTALIENEELRALYEPILRADHQLLESYDHIEKPGLDVPATALYGRQDRYSFKEMESWKQHFNSEVDILGFDGGHFFVYEQPKEVMTAVTSKIGFTEN